MTTFSPAWTVPGWLALAFLGRTGLAAPIGGRYNGPIDTRVSRPGRLVADRSRGRRGYGGPIMGCRRSAWPIIVALILFLSGTRPSSADDGPNPKAGYSVRLEIGHPWRPPFGLDRVGRPLVAVVKASERPTGADYVLSLLDRGKLVSRHEVRFPAVPPYSTRVAITGDGDELVLSTATSPKGTKAVELVRRRIDIADIEGEAIARPNQVVNPVDLGTILVPNDWLFLGPGQSATLEVAAFSRMSDVPRGELKVYYHSEPASSATKPMPLRAGVVGRQHFEIALAPPAQDRDELRVILQQDLRPLWVKAIPVMRVAKPTQHPRFGATYERLRYDAPISVRDPKTGTFSTMPYEQGWNPDLRDVVVWLTNGARFVFWRGSSYIPFWAGKHNTGACYEWAEIISQPSGAVDCVEPLMDKELRYSRVEIVESTAARVHVRWTYQSTDFHYKIWGDAAVEDYYFYPDGYGTRVVNLKSDPRNDYELSEFIILTPQSTYPLDVLPDEPLDALFLDGRKHTFRFPNPIGKTTDRPDAGGVPAIYRLRLRKGEELAAVYFNPNEMKLPPVVFGPFFDKGEMATPCYWGSHWPLARGNSTGRTIDDRVTLTPCHNSVMSWAGTRPSPLRIEERVTLDTLGRSRPMLLRRWAWLIGMSDESDGRLRERARSFATPPSIDSMRGARLAFESYVPERRAIGLAVEGQGVAMVLKPTVPCVNPVFELDPVPGRTVQVILSGRTLASREYAWDGRTLWLDATITTPTELRLTFRR
jgi:hypothetical protein